MRSTSRTYTLVVSAATWSRLQGHLAGSQAERMAFGYCSATSHRGKTRLLLREVAFPSDQAYSVQHSTGVILGATDTIPFLIRAKGSAAFLDAHSHPVPCAPYPSLMDNEAATRQYTFLQGPSPGSLLLRMIMSAEGRVWAGVQIGADNLYPLDGIHIHGPSGFELVLPVNSRLQEVNLSQDMDQRTLTCLGEDRLAKMRGLTVGVIGVGGVGSMVARLLSSLVGELILVDPDQLEPHNAPRVWFAGARSHGSKVATAQKALKRAFPELKVRTSVHAFPSPPTRNVLSRADLLFVCPDHHAVRFSASRFAATNLVPLIEVGCGGRSIAGEISALGYHVRLQVPGGPCLTCNGLDVNKLEDPHTTEAKHRLGYIENGQDIHAELAPLTTRAAAVAVDIFTRYCSGYAGIAPLHLYEDSLRLQTLDLTKHYASDPGCPACGCPDRWPMSQPEVLASPRALE